MVAQRENAQLAARLIQESCYKQDIVPGQIMLHSDRGATMKSLSLAMLLAMLAVTKSFSRPHHSDENPFAESKFKILKYCPEFPDRFGFIQDAITFCRRFFETSKFGRTNNGFTFFASPRGVACARLWGSARWRSERSCAGSSALSRGGSARDASCLLFPIL